MLRKLLIFIFVPFLFSKVQGQSEEYKKHLNFVLSKSIRNKSFTYNTTNDSLNTTTSKITFLGKSKKGYKVLHIQETYPAVLVRHGYIALLVIDKKGRRYLYRDLEKPEKMNNGVLLFKYLDRGNQVHYFRQDLNKELPKFLCQAKNDCYNYTILK